MFKNMKEYCNNDTQTAALISSRISPRRAQALLSACGGL